MSDHGRYRVLRKIADGGMAEIFLGSQRGAVGFERPVVLKRIRPDFAADQKFRDALIDEAHIAMSLNHSNIVQVLDLGVAAGATFLVLEFVDGWDLDRILRRAEQAKLPLPPELALHVVIETCRALGYAHARARDGKPLGIVHRDVSPHNILVSEQGEVKLTDFGIAMARTKRGVSQIGSVKGKIGFMSPEQASGQPLDGRSDLFALGTTLYLMITGKLPFLGGSDGKTLALTRKAEFVDPEKMFPGIAPEVARLIKRAMKRDPEDRYRNAEEMLADAEQVQRQTLRPAGQTELKQWLAKLSQLDHAMPLGRAGPPPLPEKVDSELVLEIAESSGENPVVARPPPPPPQSQASGEFTEDTGAQTQLAPFVDADRAGPRWRVGLLGAALVVSLGAAAWQFGLLDRWLPAPLAKECRASPGAKGRPPLAAAGADAGVTFAAWVGDQGAAGLSPNQDAGDEAALADSAARDDAGEEAALHDGGEAAREAQAARGDAGEGTQAGQHDLAAVPAHADAGYRVDLARRPDAGEPGTVRVYVARREPPPDAGDDVIFVQLLSTPPGATVSVNGRSYGETPGGMRFTALLTYDVEVVKDGYSPLKARVYLPRRNGQVMEATLLPR